MRIAGKNLPPLHMRREVGTLRDFEDNAGEIRTCMKLLCAVEPKHTILDIGCGCGRLALALEPCIPQGRYIGFDVQRKLINWCQRNISNSRPAFRFFHFNVYSDRYNPGGAPLRSIAGSRKWMTQASIASSPIRSLLIS
jgi:hypothetical protein